MTSFDNRENAFENKFAHNEKMDFAMEARLSKFYGLWAAEKLGLDGANAQTYAMQVVEANLEEPGFQDILRKVRADFDEKNLDISDHVMEAELDICLKKAKDQADKS
ncbi:MAG: hypothetical protein COB36_03845 [Alphaproteobacteria bacterium]|nr:MAG: hypothetical protein COB36_03845 [Alphaproteobacteria bacterium]